MTVKECLLRVHELDKAVDAAMAQIATIESDAERTTQLYGGVHVDGGTSDRESVLIRLTAARRRCNAINDEYINYKLMVIDRINLLASSDFRRVLTIMYVGKKSDGGYYDWEECAELMHYSARHVQRIHGGALLAFASVMPTEQDVAKCRGMS